MNPVAIVLTFAWISGLGLGFAILSDHLWPILIGLAVFTVLVVKALPERG